VELSGKIDAFLRKAYRYGFAVNIQIVSELFDKTVMDLWSKIIIPQPLLIHCTVTR